MAGGIGSRFWPFSKNNKPKQFLDFFGIGRSLLQMTFDRFANVVPAENILIVTNKVYKQLILEQLPQIKESQILLEPMRRNTAPCIAYAISRIKSENENANIIVAPSDHLILKESEFLDVIRKGLDYVKHNDTLLTLGIKPNRPETGYGYIQIEEMNGEFCKVKTFTEKPDLELAKVFLESGEFFWNSGIFLWNVQTIYKAFEELLPDVFARFESGKEKWNTPEEEAFINEIYPSCENVSIDYGILEKANNVSVLCAEFGWSDLGTWGSLYELSPKDENENVTLKCYTQFYQSKGNVVALPEGKLAVIEGLQDYIIAESDHTILICRKTEEQKIRQMVNDVAVRFDGDYI